MGIENVQRRDAHDPFGPSAQEPPQRAIHPLDTPESQARLLKISNWWDQAREAQAESRFEMAKDEDFYDGFQWSDEDARDLDERGQAAYVFNKIKSSIDWISGSEKRMRFDFKVLPRGREDIQGADVKTKLLKYVQDVNKGAFARSKAFKQSVIAGLSWLEDGIRSDPTDEPIFSRWESWRNVWYDHLSRELDYSQDARYLFRAKWTDLDIATAMFPDRAAEITSAAVASDLYGNDDDEMSWLNYRLSADGRQSSRHTFFDDALNLNNHRPRVRLVECWYRQPENVQLIRGFPRNEGHIFDPADGFHQKLIQGGHASLYDALKLMMRCAIFVTGGPHATGTLLQDMPTPYRHNKFPFTPIWCYRRGRDNTPYGVVRNLRDPQEDLNKRRSKALFVLSSKGMIADNDAFDDWNEVADEMARPDMILKKKPNSNVEIRSDTALAEEHVMLMQEDAKYIQDVAGVTDENMGRETNATSGIAITARQDQGSVASAELFDNYRLGFQFEGEVELSLLEQFYDEPKILRLVGPRGQVEFLQLNQPFLDDKGQPQLNDITATQSDFIVDAQDFQQSVRMAMFKEIMGLITKLPPEIALQLLDLAIEMTDSPNTEEMVQRIRKINGQGDPTQENDPEAQAAAQEKELAQEDAQRQEMAVQNQAMTQQLQEQAAKIRKLLADADLVQQKTNTERAHQAAILAKPQSDAAKLTAEQQKLAAQREDQAHRHSMDRIKIIQQANSEQNKPQTGSKTAKPKTEKAPLPQVDTESAS